MPHRVPGYLRLHAMLPIVVLGATFTADAEMIGGWHFNDLDGSELEMIADHGSGLLSRDQLGGAFLLYEGTTLNAASDDLAGQAIGVRGSGANGTWFELACASVPGLECTLSFAWRSTATGFDDNLVQYRVGRDWLTLGAFGEDADGGWKRVALSFVGGLEETRLRIRLDGADGANGVTRFDNLQLASVPAPGAWALCAVGGLLGTVSRVRRH
jgi:hypothetical protein